MQPEEPLQGGGAKRKIMLKDHHMNLQPSAPISGQKIKRVKPFTIKDPSKYLERLRSSPCRSKSQKKCDSKKLRKSCCEAVLLPQTHEQELSVVNENSYQ